MVPSNRRCRYPSCHHCMMDHSVWTTDWYFRLGNVVLAVTAMVSTPHSAPRLASTLQAAANLATASDHHCPSFDPTTLHDRYLDSAVVLVGMSSHVSHLGANAVKRPTNPSSDQSFSIDLNQKRTRHWNLRQRLRTPPTVRSWESPCDPAQKLLNFRPKLPLNRHFAHSRNLATTPSWGPKAVMICCQGTNHRCSGSAICRAISVAILGTLPLSDPLGNHRHHPLHPNGMQFQSRWWEPNYSRPPWAPWSAKVEPNSDEPIAPSCSRPPQSATPCRDSRSACCW